MNYPQRIINFILDTIFPITCLGCGLFSPINKKAYLCNSCLQLVPIKKDLECIGCKTKSPLGKTCLRCRDWSLDHLLVVSDYKNKVLERTIKAFKYRFVVDVAESIKPLIKKYIYFLARERGFNIGTDSPLIVAIPLHYRRLNWRGFNQAEIISKIIAEITNLRSESGILTRSSASRPQAEINKRGERMTNMGHQFEIHDKTNLDGKTLLLIDDICTTGATLNEAAKLLKSKGAKKIIGFVIARG